MKTIHSIFSILLVAALFFGTACSSDNLSEPQEPAVIALSMPDIATRGGNLFAGDEMITKIRVYVCSGTIVQNMRVYNTGEDAFNNPFRIQTTTGLKTVYVIANEPNDLSATLDGITTLSELNAVVTSVSSGPLATPLTMVGSESVNVVSVPAPDNPTQVTVSLTRLAAQIKLKIKKGESSTANIVLKSVQLFRGAAKSTLIEAQPVIGQTYWKHKYTGQGEVQLNTAGVDAWTGATPMYLYENTGSIADTTGRATYLIIDARYNNVDTRYQAYINDENSNAVDHKYSIKRNHQYVLTATINNIGEFDGLTLNTYVLPWNKLSSEVVFNRTFTISPQPTVSNHTYTVNNSTDIVTFTFKLTNPIGANWSAHLSNPTEFEFSTAAGAVSSGGLGIEYTISIKPRNPQGNTVRTTEFYIIVGGENYTNSELPIIEESSLVGPGDRVIINQPAI